MKKSSQQLVFSTCHVLLHNYTVKFYDNNDNYDNFVKTYKLIVCFLKTITFS